MDIYHWTEYLKKYKPEKKPKIMKGQKYIKKETLLSRGFSHKTLERNYTITPKLQAFNTGLQIQADFLVYYISTRNQDKIELYYK